MSQVTSKDAVLSIGGTTIGHLKNISWGFTVRPIVEYDLAGGDPDIHEPGEVEYNFAADFGWVADAVRAVIKNLKVAIIVYPTGNVSGHPRHTLTDALLNFTERVEKNRVIMVNVTGGYRTETIDTVP